MSTNVYINAFEIEIKIIFLFVFNCRNYLGDQKLFAEYKLDEIEDCEGPRFGEHHSHNQHGEEGVLVDKFVYYGKSHIPQHFDESTLLDGESSSFNNQKTLSHKQVLPQQVVPKEVAIRQPATINSNTNAYATTTVTNAIKKSNIKCQILKNKSPLPVTNVTTTAAQITPTKKKIANSTKQTNNNKHKKRLYVILNDNKQKCKKQQDQAQSSNKHKEDTFEYIVKNSGSINCSVSNNGVKTFNGPNPVPCRNECDTTTKVCDQLEFLDRTEYEHENKRERSFRRNSLSGRKSLSSAGGCESKNSSSPKHSKFKSRSPIQNSEPEPIIVEPSKKRFSYCSSCSSSNSCNCDITGENSNTLFEGFGVGVVVSSGSYTDDCGTGSGGTNSLASAANSQGGPLSSSFRGLNNSHNLFDSQRHGVEYIEHFTDREEDIDQTEGASDIYSDFDETCSEPPSLIEDLPRIEIENKILSNNLKNYSKFHEKLYKKQQQQQYISSHFISDIHTQNYQNPNFLHHSDYSTYQKDSLEHNLFLSYSNNCLNFNTMNFDARNKNGGQSAEGLTRTGQPPSNGVGGGLGGDGVEEIADQNDLNIYCKSTCI